MYRLLLVILLLSQNAWARVPGAWGDEVEMDRDHNIAGRSHEIRQGQPDVIFYEFHVPKDKATVVHGDQEDLPEHFWPIVDTRDGGIVRIFVPDMPGVADLDKIKKDFGEPVKTWMGRRIQGKASFHMFDPNDPDAEPVRIKIEKNFLGTRVNTAIQGRYSVLLSSLIKKLEKLKPSPLASFYVEPFSASIKGEGYSYSYILRRIPREASSRTQNEIFVPLHGFIGSGLVYEMAKKSGMSHYRWMTKEFFPKLAQVTAHYNFDLGVWFEGHTQNMSLLLDSKTGKIKKFFIKDAADVLISPLQQALRGTLPSYDFIPPSRLNEEWVDPRDPSLKDAGDYNVNFVFQCAFHITESRVLQMHYIHSFLKSLVEASGLSTSQLSSETQAIIKSFRPTVGKLLKNFVPSFLGGEDFQPPDILEAVPAVQEITDLRHKLDFQKLLAESKLRLTAAQADGLRKIVRRHLFEKKFNFAFPDSNEKTKEIEFHDLKGLLPVPNGVIVYDINTKTPIGVAYHLSEEDTRFVDSLVSPHPKVQEAPSATAIDCEVGLEGLGVQ